ncbi:TolC family protein [Sphingobacterium sp. LRF_L2]|uniref:TolC family protein n=1 Tax=Sphingobacterium sp. LRF_L2 TaxID=3369421 RepID=UPI003F5D8ACC
MNRTQAFKYTVYICSAAFLAACNVPKIKEKIASTNTLPDSYVGHADSTNIALTNWNDYFADPFLRRLIDSALNNNQELNIMLQEIKMSANEVMARKGEYLPFVGAKAGAGVEKRSEYTTLGAAERQVDIRDGKENPDPMPDLTASLFANWEIDIWNKLHNAAQSAQLRYLSSIEGKNFMVTNLVGEIANLYYELLSLDQQLLLLNQTLKLQSDALDLVKLQKTATRVTELAVKKFEAEVYMTEGRQYEIAQQILETENKLNYLVGQYPQHIARSTDGLDFKYLPTIDEGLPAQLLGNRPDIREAELHMAASKLDVKVAKAKFYPALGISASFGYQAFNPAYLIKTPQSLIYSLTGDLIAPLINKKAIQADYLNANAQQIQSVYVYEQKLLNAYIEVANQLSKFNNMRNLNTIKGKQVGALTESVQISYDLFNSAHADYMEVLMTQRDAIEAKFELIESQRSQFIAVVDLYRSLGGGWR